MNTTHLEDSMNRFTPCLETLNGRDVPSAVAPGVLTAGPAALHAAVGLATGVVSVTVAGAASGGVLGGTAGGIVGAAGGVSGGVLGGAYGGVLGGVSGGVLAADHPLDVDGIQVTVSRTPWEEIPQ